MEIILFYSEIKSGIQSQERSIVMKELSSK